MSTADPPPELHKRNPAVPPTPKPVRAEPVEALPSLLLKGRKKEKSGLRQAQPERCWDRSPPHPQESGFTLVEMMVALTIFSLAALALLRLEGATLSNAADLEHQSMAQIVAGNLAVEATTDPVPPALGAASGQVLNGGRTWSWVRSTRRSPEPRILQIEIAVADEAGREAARLTLFRRGAQ